MPHQCTGCGHTFEDGSKEMLSGCPECGGNKFQFRPADSSGDASTDGSETDPTAADPDADGSDRTAPPSDRPDPETSSVAETFGRATTKVRDFVASDPPRSRSDPDSGSDSDSSSEWPDEWESGSSIASDDPRSPPDPSASGGDTTPNGDGDARERKNIIDADARRNARGDTDEPKEDAAQASARTDVVSSEELDESAVMDDASGSAPEPEPGTAASAPASGSDDTPTAPSSDPERERPDSSPIPESDPAPDGEVVSEPTGEEPDLAELREQLNDQFESIKILEPGQYELNLMELYDREEYIIALQENGRYVIQVPEQWIGEDADDR